MKKLFRTYWIPMAGLSVILIILCAFKDPAPAQPVRSFRFIQDTTPSNRSYRTEQLDEVTRALNNIDRASIEAQVQKAMAQVKAIDFEKIAREVNASMKKIDWDKTRAEVSKAMLDADRQIKNIDFAKINKEVALAMENIKKENIMAKIDMEGIHQKVAESLAIAKESIDKAKAEMNQMKQFINSLEKDGLINKKKGYKIEVKDKQLFINGKAQPKEVNEKYKKELDKDDFSISSDGDDISFV